MPDFVEFQETTHQVPFGYGSILASLQMDKGSGQ